MCEKKQSCCGGSADSSIKDFVKQKYGQLAEDARDRKETSCCGSGKRDDPITRDLYSESECAALPEEAPAEELADLAGSVVSAFIRAVKPAN